LAHANAGQGSHFVEGGTSELVEECGWKFLDKPYIVSGHIKQALRLSRQDPRPISSFSIYLDSLRFPFPALTEHKHGRCFSFSQIRSPR
jgi:hypothetical protein